jgi:hypothetical protein
MNNIKFSWLATSSLPQILVKSKDSLELADSEEKPSPQEWGDKILQLP